MLTLLRAALNKIWRRGRQELSREGLGLEYVVLCPSSAADLETTGKSDQKCWSCGNHALGVLPVRGHLLDHNFWDVCVSAKALLFLGDG